MRKILIPLEISPISADILPVIRQIFPPLAVELTLVAVAQPRTETPIVVDAHMMALPPSVYTETVEYDEEWDAYRTELKEKLELAAQALRTDGYTVYTVLLQGSTIAEIVNFVEKRPFDLLALATYGRKGLRRLVYGSVAEELLRLVAVPLLLVRHQPNAKRVIKLVEKTPLPLPAEPKQTIVVATDGAPQTQQAVLLARQLAERLKFNLEVLVNARMRSGAEYGQQVMLATKELLQDMQPPAELIPLVGPPDEVLGRHLEKSTAALLVVGPFKDGSRTVDIGITAQRVVHTAPMPVLVCKGQRLRIERLLACVERNDMWLVERALWFAKTLGAELQLLHVLPAEPNAASRWLAPDDLALTVRMAQDPQLAAFLRQTIVTLETAGLSRSALQVWCGDTLRTILNVTKRGHHDLILVGDQNRAAFFPGSLADSVVRFAPKSVLIVRQRPR